MGVQMGVQMGSTRGPDGDLKGRSTFCTNPVILTDHHLNKPHKFTHAHPMSACTQFFNTNSRSNVDQYGEHHYKVVYMYHTSCECDYKAVLYYAFLFSSVLYVCLCYYRLNPSH